MPAQPSAQLSAYLAANQPQAAALGQTVANTVGGQVNAAGAAIQPAVDVYTGQLYTVPTDAAANAAVTAAPSSLTPDQQASFKAELGASAAAPNSANTFEASAPYQGVASGIQNAVEEAGLWNSGNNVANLSTALSPYEGGNATAGDTTLDALLLSQSPGAYGQIQNAVAPAAGFQGQLAIGTANADAALQAAIQADQAATPAAQAAAQSYAKNLTDYLNQAVATAQAASSGTGSENSTLMTDISSGNMTAADAQALGIPAANAAAYANAFDNFNSTVNAENALRGNNTRTEGAGLPPLATLNLASYLTPGAAGITPTLANMASAGNYSDAAALQELLAGGTPITLPIDASTAAQAGTGGPSTGTTFNSSGFGAAVAPELQAAQALSNFIKQDISFDPAQTPAQAGVDTQAEKNMKNILAYLNIFAGSNPPPPGYTTGMGGGPGIT